MVRGYVRATQPGTNFCVLLIDDPSKEGRAGLGLGEVTPKLHLMFVHSYAYSGCVNSRSVNAFLDLLAVKTCRHWFSATYGLRGR